MCLTQVENNILMKNSGETVMSRKCPMKHIIQVYLRTHYEKRAMQTAWSFFSVLWIVNQMCLWIWNSHLWMARTRQYESDNILSWNWNIFSKNVVYFVHQSSLSSPFKRNMQSAHRLYLKIQGIWLDIRLLMWNVKNRYLWEMSDAIVNTGWSWYGKFFLVYFINCIYFNNK